MAPLSTRWWRMFGAHRAVAREAESVLRGHAIERYRGSTHPIPAWTALNGVAHGDLCRIRALAAPDTWRPLSPSSPLDAAVLIAREVSAIVGDDDELLWLLQTIVLIPLEAQILALPEPVRISPRELLSAVRADLHQVLR